MREMKDSGIEWVGATPETWKMIPLKYLASYNDEVLSENTDDEFEFDYIEIGSVQYGRGIIYTEHMKFKNAPSRARRIVRKDDIIVSTVRTYLKAVATIPACNNSLIASTGFIVIRPHKVLPRFMNYALLSESFISLVESHSTGISYPAINSIDVVKFKIPVPCRSEQERIAAFLDAECAEIDTVLEKTRASIEEYKKLKQAIITQAVTKGIRGDRPMKDSGIEWIGEIPAEWDVLNLVAHTSMLTPMRDRPENLDGPIPWVRIEDFEGKYIESSKAGLGVSMKTVKEMNLKVYPVGTILCTSSCIMGKCAIVSRELVSNQRFIGIIPDQTTDKTYLYYLMTSNAERMNFLSTGALQANLSRSAFEHLKVQFPPYSEQQEIAAYLDDKCEKIDELILKKQQYLTEIENYKKSLIYEYVTGKREV